MGILRVFLAYIVLLSHAPNGYLQKISHPALAVQCFYVISGFYMQLLINEYQTQENWKKKFYLSRFVRIFPSYWIVLFLTALLLPVTLNYYFVSDVPGKLLFSANNILLIPQDIILFFNLPSMTMMGQSWTLSLEIMFYLIAPFILTKRLLTLILIVSFSVLLRFNLRDYGLYNDPWFYRFFPLEIGSFVSGAIAYRYYINFIKNNYLNITLKFVGLLCLCYLIYFLYEGWHYIEGPGYWNSPELFAVPVKYWSCLFMTIAFLPFIFNFSKSLKFDRFIGELSYPIYIGQFLFIELLAKYKVVSDYYLGLAALISTIVFSILLYFLIEKPLHKIRYKLRSLQVGLPNPTCKPASTPTLSSLSADSIGR